MLVLIEFPVSIPVRCDPPSEIGAITTGAPASQSAPGLRSDRASEKAREWRAFRAAGPLVARAQFPPDNAVQSAARCLRLGSSAHLIQSASLPRLTHADMPRSLGMNASRQFCRLAPPSFYLGAMAVIVQRFGLADAVAPSNCVATVSPAILRPMSSPTLVEKR